MNISFKKIIVFILVFLFCSFAYWIGGYDFNARGPVGVSWLIMSTYFGGLAVTFTK